MSRNLILLCRSAVVMLLAVASAAAQNPIVVFDAPGAADTRAYSINAGNEVTGTWYDAGQSGHGFHRSAAGIVTSFDVPGASQGFTLGTLAISINDAGSIVGQYTTKDRGNNVFHGFVRDPLGNLTTFDVPGAVSGNFEGTFVAASNNLGQVAGYFTAPDLTTQGFVRDAAGNFTTFDAAGTGYTNVLGINDLGDVVGVYRDKSFAGHGFVRNGLTGEVTAFDAPFAQASETVALGINRAGVVIGSYQTPDGDCGFIEHGFIRYPSGSFVKVDIAGSLFGTRVTGINSAGSTVGLYTTQANVYISFVRDPKGVITFFRAPGAGNSYGQGTLAYAINRKGSVAGLVADQKSPNHGFVRK